MNCRPDTGYDGADKVLNLFFPAVILPALFTAKDKACDRHQPGYREQYNCKRLDSERQEKC